MSQQPTGKILIVEDEQAHGDAIAEILSRAGHEVRVVTDARQAEEALNDSRFDVVITDYRLGGQRTGIDVLRGAKQKWPHCEVILITAYGNEELARQALREEGAYDYITKPLDMDELRSVTLRAVRQAVSTDQNQQLRNALNEATGMDGIIARSPAMARILKRIRQVAASNITVLLLGESGTGKDLLAQAIHNHSPRRDRRLVTLDCAGLSEGILESELFGHVRGAFTGAAGDRKGRFEYADGSTLFLDEIGEMPLTMQAKLLRVLENREVIRVGANDPIKIDVRMISATNRDLAEDVANGKFREDLYFRLKGVVLRIPPLRERPEDIPLLVDYFIDQFNNEQGQSMGKHITGLSADVRQQMLSYSWRGNVRELRHVVEQMCVLSEDETLDMDDLPDEIRGYQPLPVPRLDTMIGKSMDEVEKEHIINTLKLTNGNREQAAKILGMGARTLYRKLKEYDIS